MNTHHLKIWPDYYKEVIEGCKKAEVRLNDRNFQVGDILLLQEYNPVRDYYTGNIVTVNVTHILPLKKILSLEANIVVLSIEIIKIHTDRTQKIECSICKDSVLFDKLRKCTTQNNCLNIGVWVRYNNSNHYTITKQ